MHRVQRNDLFLGCFREFLIFEVVRENEFQHRIADGATQFFLGRSRTAAQKPLSDSPRKMQTAPGIPEAVATANNSFPAKVT
jgi:hypothetical protein